MSNGLIPVSNNMQRFLAAMPEQCQTLKGAACMLADMTEVGSLRSVAAKWFTDAGRAVQVDLIRSLGQDGARARALLYLCPDATPLLARLTTLQLRAICDDHSALLASLKGRQVLTILNAIGRSGVRYDWLLMISEALRDHPEWSMRLFDDVSADELALPFVSLLGVNALSDLEEAIVNPLAFEELLPEVGFLFAQLAEHDYTLYLQTIECLVGELLQDDERRQMQRSQRLIVGQYVRSWRHDIDGMGEES